MTGGGISRVTSRVSLVKCVSGMWVDEVVGLEERHRQSSNRMASESLLIDDLLANKTPSAHPPISISFAA